MENYILWGATAADNALALLVTRVNLQRIGKGTREFVHALLEELGIDAMPKEWRIAAHFITDYLTNDPDSNEWEDSWSETWDFRIPVDVSRLRLPASNDLRRTAWYDETVEDNELSFPILLVLFAEFQSDEQPDAARRELHELFSDSSGSAGDAALRAAIDAIPEQQRSGLSANTRGSLLQVSLGLVGEDFIESSRPLMDAVRAWIEAHGGVTTWDERHT